MYPYKATELWFVRQRLCRYCWYACRSDWQEGNYIFCTESIAGIGSICHHFYADTITCTRDIKLPVVVASAEKGRGRLVLERDPGSA